MHTFQPTSQEWCRRCSGLIRIISCTTLLLFALGLAPAARSWADASSDSTDLLELSLEDLMDVEVVSVSRKKEKLTEAAAAVFVITGEDLRQMGATSIPDALRSVPGLQVASIDANTWAVSSRGFNANFANKLLVMIDGRSVYTPLFSGVWWDAQDVMLHDVERIEIIRGPGATLWGANAVNGVINILTKKAQDTRGALATMRAGNYEAGQVEFRYGHTVGPRGALRVYGKAFERRAFADEAGLWSADDWSMLRGGLRYDAALSDRDSIMVSGDAYDGDVGATHALPVISAPYLQVSETRTKARGAHALGRWSRALSPTSRLSVQMFYDYTRRHDIVVRSQQSMIDAEVQHSFGWSSKTQLIWGLGYRAVFDHYFNNIFVTIDPAIRTINLASGFAQMDAQIVPGRLRLSLGTKVEYNDYTGMEVQPNVRLLWHPASRHTIWTAASRAVRLPSRGEREGQIVAAVLPPLTLGATQPLPLQIDIVGSDQSVSESVVAYELGYRVQPNASVALDVATFLNRYENLLSGEVGAATVDPLDPTYATLPLNITNDRKVEALGAEVAADWLAHRNLRLRFAYTFIDFLDADADAVQDVTLNTSGTAPFESPGPRHQVSLFSVLDLTRQLQVSARYRFVDGIPSLALEHYTTLDARLAWQPTRNLTWALAGQDLLQSRHQEFRSELTRVSTRPVRRFYTELIWGM